MVDVCLRSVRDSPPSSRGLLAISLFSGLVPGDAVSSLEVEGVLAVGVLCAVVLEDRDGRLVAVGDDHGHQAGELCGDSSMRITNTKTFS